ncbi:motility associated factor glycosyltransferase family protein [Pseudoalteromonas luteoviolacea]|uniref:Septum formation inhibitor Maf n=1 Tax=Pseudoalteromonas luteoviolacea H33 TaxID=1365251 RepID=A0A167C3P6_9GAMM|nr:6-hydroxymethylpterin diphosphokinase MptE-like protein [Pseudoalteromonas luteoviolacea]KZN47200.1 hypothetical protein N476_23765 [Pseudoalteromonas luteoviolacea H33]KZN77184.1 hypothetical protein N477_12425 [Pseudoalteromonas luteoviolacea H33-S]MBQ4879337.1 motility associated factor glycosyltransferase family protein [Pseudoalteromonas luteoviolacea]MBQ4908397.1 motility associated factor glycosyltransferase family protein [Pseudoalteromonas luteoviolacea]
MKDKSLEQQIESLSEQLNVSIEQQQREAQFATEANERFSKNIACFEEYFPDIAETFKNYSVREDFCIHVTKTGHGNFVPKGYSAPIYSEDPIEQTRVQVMNSIESAVFCSTDYSSYPSAGDDERIHVRYMAALSEVMQEVQKNEPERISKLPENFPTGLIFGVGLGYHVPLLLEQTTFDYLFFVEPDLEIFFASLFCTDWFDIIKTIDEQGGNLFFQLGADTKTFIKDLEIVANNIGAFSIVRSFCYQHTPQPEIVALIQQWSSEYFRFQFGHGFFNDAITGLAHSIHLMEKNVAVLAGKESTNVDYSTPVFIVGNGPSLDEAEEFIKQNHENAIVMAAGTSIATLYNKGIPVDFHILVERPYSNYKIFGDILPAEIYKQTNLIGLNTLYPDNVERYKWAGIAAKDNEAGTFLMGMLDHFHGGNGLPFIPFCNPVVANAALSFAMYAGFKNIYLFGIDNGNLLTGEHHSKDSIYKVDQKNDEEEGMLCLAMDGKYLPANFGGQVETNQLFAVAHSQLEKLIDYYPKRAVYNVGNGAKITGAHAVPAEELLPIPEKPNKQVQIEAIKSDFFQQLNIQAVDEQYIGISAFNEMCDHLIELASEDVKNRKAASDCLMRQARFVYSYKNTPLSHLFHMVKGALLYYHCPLLTLLYTYKDEHYTLQSYTKLNTLWISYISEMKDFYELNYRAKCDLGKE